MKLGSAVICNLQTTEMVFFPPMHGSVNAGETGAVTVVFASLVMLD